MTWLPHGYCLLWNRELIALIIAGNAGIALAYFAIPYFLVSFRRTLPVQYRYTRWMQAQFAAFIFLCGLTHVFGVVVLYLPWYRTEAVIRLATAAISLWTAWSVRSMAYR